MLVAPTDSTQASSATTGDISGVWNGKMGQFDLTLNLTAAGNKLTGTVKSPMGETPIADGIINGNEFSFTVSRQGNIIPYTGKLTGNTLTISVNFNGRAMEGIFNRVQ